MSFALFQEYRAYKNDSAVSYLNRCIALAERMLMAVAMYINQHEPDPFYRVLINGKECQLTFTQLRIEKEKYVEGSGNISIIECLNETKNREYYTIQSYRTILSELLFIFGTSTNTNARTNIGQLANCFVGVTPDNIEGIFDCYKEQALISKGGGGIGWDYSLIRGSKSPIDAFENASNGPIPYLKITNSVMNAVDQLGTRKGSQSPYLTIWHWDIKSFLKISKKFVDERIKAEDLFPAIIVPDIFMKRVNANENWSLFNPYNTKILDELYDREDEEIFSKAYVELENDKSIPRTKIKALSLWKDVLKGVVVDGMPFILFRDTANQANMNKDWGMIRSSNLCVTGDSYVSTEDGIKKISHLFQDKYDGRVVVDSRTEDMDAMNSIEDTFLATLSRKTQKELQELYRKRKIELRSHNGFFLTNENANIYKIITDGALELKSTSWHKYYVFNSNTGEIVKKPLSQINIFTDELLIQNTPGVFGSRNSCELIEKILTIRNIINTLKQKNIAFNIQDNNIVITEEFITECCNMNFVIEKTIGQELYSLIPDFERDSHTGMYTIYLRNSIISKVNAILEDVKNKTETDNKNKEKNMPKDHNHKAWKE
jgi:ribonucleotide reductase alpha subunit